MIGSPGGPLWGLYDPPTREAVIADLQSLRQDPAPLSAASVRGRYALFHIPSVIRVADLDRRAELLVRSLRASLVASQLSTEQRIIARWMFDPPAEARQQYLHERRKAASEEIAISVQGDHDEPLRRTAKQVEDREPRVLMILAEALLDSNPGPDVLGPDETPLPVDAPIDPYESKGYVWTESEHRLRFDDDDPRLQWLRYAITLQAVRHDQRLFWIRHDPILDGEELPIEVLSADAGHSLLGRVPDGLPNQRRAHLLYFHLGRALQVGETTRLVFARGFHQDSPNQPWFGMEMDGTPQERLLLEVILPPRLGANSWSTEEWSSGSAGARLLGRESFDIPGQQTTSARYEILSPRPWHHYRIVWEVGADADPDREDGPT